MRYPIKEQVDNADRVQLLRWTRYLPSPGEAYLDGDKDVFYKKMKEEADIMDHILQRQKDTGGITPEISKIVGWG